MKTKTFHLLSISLKLILFFLLPLSVTSQNFSNTPQNILSQNIIAPMDIHLADLDGDEDLDIIYSYPNGIFSWLKNLDGQGNYGTPQTIASISYFMGDIHTGDVDGDGDLDIITINPAGVERLSWFENLDGLGTFSSSQAISGQSIAMLNAHPADLDGDGDLDVLTHSQNFAQGDNIVWYKNTDGLGNFSAPLTIFNFPSNSSTNFMGDVYAADLDGDGDLDVIASSPADNQISWYKNLDGLGNFGSPQPIATSVFGLSYDNLYTADFDGDGDLDLLSGTINDRITWYENTDGQGTFGLPQIISIFTANDLNEVYPVDVDGDGDLDVVSVQNYSISWFENTNCGGSFGPEQIIVPYLQGTNTAGSDLSLGDIDGDGDMDLLIGDSNQIRIEWYENITQPSPQTYLPNELYICNDNFEELCGPYFPSCSNATYNWYYNHPNGTSLLVGNNQCYTPNQYGKYTLVVQDENGVYTNYTVNVLNALPQPILGVNGEVCIGDLVSISGQGFDSSSHNITWFHNGTIVQQGGSTLTTSFTSGTITVEISYRGCKGIVSASAEVKTCCPDKVPILGSNGEICIGEIVSIDGQGFDSSFYQITWLHNGTIVQQGGTTLTTSFNSGTITVQVSYKGCKEVYSASVLLKECCDGKKCSDRNTFKIYPNPTNDKITINSAHKTNIKIQILDKSGNLIIEKTSSNSSRYEVDLSNLKPGLYIAKIISKDKTLTKKIIKE